MLRLLSVLFIAAILFPSPASAGCFDDGEMRLGFVFDRVRGAPEQAWWPQTDWSGVGSTRENFERDLATAASMGAKQATLYLMPCKSGIDMTYSKTACANPSAGCTPWTRDINDVNQSVANLTGTAQGSATVPSIGLIDLISSYGMRTILAFGVQRLIRYGCVYPNFDQSGKGWNVVYGDSANGWANLEADAVWWITEHVTRIEATASAPEVIYDIGDEIWYDAPYPSSESSTAPNVYIQSLMRELLSIDEIPEQKLAVRLLKSCHSQYLRTDSQNVSRTPQYVGHSIYVNQQYGQEPDFDCGWQKYDVPAQLYTLATYFNASCSYIGEFSSHECEGLLEVSSEDAVTFSDGLLVGNMRAAGVDVAQHWRLWSSPTLTNPKCSSSQPLHGLTKHVDEPKDVWGNYISSSFSLWGNGDFEQNRQGWYGFGDRPTVSRVGPLEGGSGAAVNKHWLRLQNKGGTSTLCSPSRSVNPGQRVAVSGYLRSNQKNVTMQYRWTGSSAQVDVALSPAESVNWQNIQYLSSAATAPTAPSGASAVQVCFSATSPLPSGCGGTLALDLDGMSLAVFDPLAPLQVATERLETTGWYAVGSPAFGALSMQTGYTTFGSGLLVGPTYNHIAVNGNDSNDVANDFTRRYTSVEVLLPAANVGDFGGLPPRIASDFDGEHLFLGVGNKNSPWERYGIAVESTNIFIEYEPPGPAEFIGHVPYGGAGNFFYDQAFAPNLMEDEWYRMEVLISDNGDGTMDIVAWLTKDGAQVATTTMENAPTPSHWPSADTVGILGGALNSVSDVMQFRNYYSYTE